MTGPKDEANTSSEDIFGGMDMGRLSRMSDDEMDNLIKLSAISADAGGDHDLEQFQQSVQDSVHVSYPDDAEDIVLDIDNDQRPPIAPRTDPSTDKRFTDQSDVDIDPTTVPDAAVADSVSDDGDDGDDADSVNDALNNSPFALGGDGKPRFAPIRPDVPDSDLSAEPGDGAPPSYTPPPLPPTTDLTEGLDDFGNEIGEDDDSEGSPGIAARAKEFFGRVPRKAVVACAATVLIVGLVLGAMVAQGSGGENGPQGSDPAALGGGQIDQGGAAQAPLGDGTSGEPENLIGQVQVQVSDNECPDPSTSPQEAFIADEQKAWVCYRAHGIDGAILNIVFSKNVTLHEIRFTPGFNYVREPSGDDEWTKHRVVTKILWRAGGKQFPQDVPAVRSEVTFTFPEPVTTRSMSMTIQQSVSGDEATGQGQGMDPGAGAHEGAFENVGPEGDGGAPSGKTVDATAIQHIQLIGTVA